MQELQGRAVSAAEVGSAEELLRVRKEIVDFHGEMVLLENYSALNYTGEHALPCRRCRPCFWLPLFVSLILDLCQCSVSTWFSRVGLVIFYGIVSHVTLYMI